MPAYPWLVENKLDGKDTATKMEVLRKLGVLTPTRTSPVHVKP